MSRLFIACNLHSKESISVCSVLKSYEVRSMKAGCGGDEFT